MQRIFFIALCFISVFFGGFTRYFPDKTDMLWHRLRKSEEESSERQIEKVRIIGDLCLVIGLAMLYFIFKKR